MHREAAAVCRSSVKTMSQDPWRHLAAISPYFHIHQQPPTPALQATRGAVYLFRHGVLEVSQYDYAAYIAVFMAKLQKSRAKGPIGKDFLAFLNHYRTWITKSHVGLVSASGMNQSFQFGKTFRQRYAHWPVSDLYQPFSVSYCPAMTASLVASLS